MSDVSSIIIWWLTSFIIGLTCLPITIRIFNRFVDKGYIFSKILGILISSYIIWLAASLHTLPFNRLTIIVVLTAIGLVNLWIISKNSENSDKNKIPWIWLIIEESLFFIALSFWSYVRATEPSIRGLEKFMDFGFVNSILRANFFPPLDIWLTRSPDYLGGYFINYYYYGHYIAAFLTKLSGIDSVITYNLMMATLFAFTFTLPFSLGTNLLYLFLSNKLSLIQKTNQQSSPLNPTKIRFLHLLIAGLLTGYLVSLGGNPHTLYVFTSGYPNEYPEPPWKLEFGFHPDRYWYPNATRFIPNTIHEFPSYSFVVADLHGHVSSIPIVFLILAILLTLVIRENDQEKKILGSGIKNFLLEFEQHSGFPLPYIGFLGLLLAIAYMTNAWDGLIYMVVTGLVFLYLNGRVKQQSRLKIFYKTFSASLFLIFSFLIAALPFLLNFKPFVDGIGVLCTPGFLADKKIGPFLFEANHCERSPIYMLVILWGFFYFNVIGFLLFIVLPKIKAYLASYRQIGESMQITTRMFANERIFGFIRKSFGSIRTFNPVDVFVLIIIFVSFLLNTFPEFFYMKDIYPTHYRANTMFKLGYQSFMMLGLVSIYTLLRIKYKFDGKVKPLSVVVYRSFFIILFTLVAIYPYFAVNSYYGGLKNYYGLDGLKWLEAEFPEDYDAVVWLRKNINCSDVSSPDCNNQPVIVEANGDSYTDYDRVSANTGLPTIVGWPVHEWLWRGSYDEAGKRIPEVETIYNSKDIEDVKDILRKYKVEYIFLGKLEREKYPNLYAEKFDDLGKVVFESGETRIYRVNPS